jgi:glycosyltransferase involved in cell wall biosynthesis
MELDVIIPTYNRQDLLKLTLESLFTAEIPSGLKVLVTVVDNNSKDATRPVVEGYQEKFAGRLRYQFEPQQGRSHALNAGVASTNGDIVGMVDDDEKIDESWYKTIFEAFKLENVDFIGGPYVPNWSIPPPEWLPQEYSGVIGWVNGGDQIVPFDETYPGMLMGGNAVIKRTLLQQVGPYSTSLGRTAKRLLSCEDEDMYRRLLEVGARGFYRPDLIIYHHIPSDRLTKSYFRRWCFWRGVSLGVLGRTKPGPSTQLFGVPRWLYRKGVVGAFKAIAAPLNRRKSPSKKFADELAMFDLAGFFCGRHFYGGS